jgi:hypothetical protein
MVINFDTKKALGAISNTHLTLVETGSGRGRWGSAKDVAQFKFF